MEKNRSIWRETKLVFLLIFILIVWEVRVIDKKNIEVVFDFDDCYREILDGLGGAGCGVSVDENGWLSGQRRRCDMARKSRKNMPSSAAGTSGNLTAQAVMDLGQDVKTYRVVVYARLSHEPEANRERDTVETQIACIKNSIGRQDDMTEAGVYTNVSVTGTTFDRPEFAA